MPTVYEQIWTRLEGGKGAISFRFLLSDDYDSLFAGADYDDRTSIDFVRIGTLKSDLDTADGLQGVDELQIEIDRTACDTSVQQTAFAFVLDCLDDTNSRYCLLYADGSLAFRGVLNSKGSGEDLVWHGSQYGVSPSPFRMWKLTAKNYAIVKLDKSIKEIMDAWKDSTVAVNFWEQWTDDWIDENVLNRNAYHPSLRTGYTPNDWDTFIRFGQLVNLNKLLRKMIDIIETIDTTIETVIEESEIPLEFFTPEIVPAVNAHNSETWNNWNINKFIARNEQSKVFSFGESVSDDDSPFVSFKLVDPAKEELSESFYRPLRFINLLFEIARSFGMYCDLQVDDLGVTHVTFLPRAKITKNADGSTKALFIRDVESASLTTEPTVFEAGKDNYVGVANRYAIDGDPANSDTYGWDVYKVKNDSNKPLIIESKLRKEIGNLTPLILSTGLTVASITPELLPESQIGIGNDFFPSTINKDTAIRYYPGTITRTTRRFNFAGDMLHNSYVTFPAEDVGRFGTLHKLLYAKTTERFYIMSGSSYIRSTTTDDDYTAWRPIWQVVAYIDGGNKSFRTLSEYVNYLTERDGKYFQTEYSLTVPYLSGFKAESGGSDSYHNLILGSVTEIDGLDYTVVGIERDFDKIETRIRLHNLERFAFDSPIAPVGEPDYTVSLGEDNSQADVAIITAGEDILADQLVSLFTDGKAYVSYPTEDHYRKVFGIALNDALTDELVTVCKAGDCTLSTLGFPRGTPLYLQEPDVDGVNITTTQITPSNSEYLWQRIGYGNENNEVFINIEEPFWYYGFPTA